MLISHAFRQFGAWLLLVVGLVLALVNARPVAAHEGPPFPILMDQPVAGFRVSVWADPDIGDALFYVVLETPSGGRPNNPPHVSMWTEPLSGRLERAIYEAKRQDLKSHLQFEAKPYFDQRDMWNVGFRIEPDGGEAAELVTQIESTPPGYGPWDLAIYLFPFLLLGGMWVVAMVRRWRSMQQPEDDETPAAPDAAQRDLAFTGINAQD